MMRLQKYFLESTETEIGELQISVVLTLMYAVENSLKNLQNWLNRKC